MTEGNDEKKSPSAFTQILIAVAIAVLAGGTAPWWWKAFAGKDQQRGVGKAPGTPEPGGGGGEKEPSPAPKDETPKDTIQRKMEAMSDQFFQKPAPPIVRVDVEETEGGSKVALYWEYEPKPSILDFIDFLRRKLGRGAVSALSNFSPAMTPSSLQLTWENIRPGDLAYQLP